jgi:hypothetical protein
MVSATLDHAATTHPSSYLPSLGRDPNPRWQQLAGCYTKRPLPSTCITSPVRSSLVIRMRITCATSSAVPTHFPGKMADWFLTMVSRSAP